MAIIAILDYIPLDHPRRQECINAELDIINVLIRFHDGETGLWYQVVDKGDRKDNWLETSCSSLFTCAIAKAIKKGLLHKSFIRYVHKAYKGIINTLIFEGDDLVVSNICVGTKVGDYQFYIDRPTVQNDLHGMGAFLLMCAEYYDTCRLLGV